MNLIIFSITLMIALFVSVVESCTYLGFLQKHFFVPSYVIYIISFVSFFFIIRSKKILEKIGENSTIQILIRLGTVLFFVFVSLYVVLNEFDINIYSNYSFSKFHIWPAGLILPILLLFQLAFLFFKTKDMGKNLKPLRRNKLTIFLSVIFFIILGFPLIKYGIDKTLFYSVDPDVVYITNSLLYTKAALIGYADHPGTPSIMLFHYLYFPLRIISKYLLHTSFIQWSFDNYEVLTAYIRATQLILTTIGFAIFSKVIKKFTNSNWITFLIGLCVFSFGGMIFAIRIVPENLSLFLTASWLFIFLKYIDKRSLLLNILMVIVAAFAVANKFTSLFLLVPSLLLPIFMNKLNLLRKFFIILLNILIASITFYIGILPAIAHITWIKNWTFSLFKHAGIHGTGTVAVFDLNSYLTSITTLFVNSTALMIFLCFVLALGIFLVVKKKIKINDPVVFLATTSFFGFLIFAKYPNVYYNYVNILLIIFCAAYFLLKTKITLTKVLIPIVVFVFIFSVLNYWKEVPNQIESKEKGETTHSLLNAWTPYWSGDVFRDQLNSAGHPIMP